MTKNYKTNRFSRIGWAILLICIGIIFLLFNLNILPVSYKPILLSWQMLLIVLGLWSLFIKKHYWGGPILIIIGILYIYPKLYALYPEYICYIDFNIKTYWPLFLIAAGLFIIISKNKFRKRCKTFNYRYDNSFNEGISDFTTQNNMDYLEKDMMFGSCEQIVLSQNFKGGETNLMFGELRIDLRKAKLSSGIINMEMNTMFGSTILYVPTDWIIDVQNSTLLGGFKDNRPIYNNDSNAEAPHLVITGGIMFGSGEIRN